MKISKIMITSLLAVALLLGSEIYALKRTHAEVYEHDENNQPPRKIQRGNEAADVTSGVCGGNEQEEASASSSTSPSRALTSLSAGDVFVLLPNEEIVRKALTTLFPNTVAAFEAMGLFKDQIVSLTSDNQVAFLHTNIIDDLGSQIVEEYPDNQEVRRHICDGLHILVRSLIMRFAEEGIAMSRALAQRYAREMVVGHDISIRLIFALLADYLHAPFFKLVAWNSFTPDEKEMYFANLNEVELGECDKLAIPFYGWEKSLEACAINELSDVEQVEHLLDPSIHVINFADNNLTDFIIGCLLYDKTNSYELVFAHEQFAALNFIIESCSIITGEAKNMTEKLQIIISSAWVYLHFSLISIRRYDPVNFTKHIFNFLRILPGLKNLYIGYLETYIREVPLPLRACQDNIDRAKSAQSFEIMQILTKGVKNLEGLKSLRFIENASLLHDVKYLIENNNFSLLIDAIRGLRCLKELILAHNSFDRLSVEQWDDLMSAVAALPQLALLDVSNNSLHPDHPCWDVIMSWLSSIRRSMSFNA